MAGCNHPASIRVQWDAQGIRPSATHAPFGRLVPSARLFTAITSLRDSGLLLAKYEQAISSQITSPETAAYAGGLNLDFDSQAKDTHVQSNPNKPLIFL